MSPGLSDIDLSRLELELNVEPKVEIMGNNNVEDTDLEISDDKVKIFANRLYDLSKMEYKSELEEDIAIYEILNEIERVYFFRRFIKRATKAAKSLIKKGLKQAQKLLGKEPEIRDVVIGVTHLIRGNLRGLLSTLAKTGLKPVSPVAGTAAVTAMNALGFELAQLEKNREAWRRFVLVSRDAYDYLTRNLNEHADEPIEASRLAMEAFNHAIKQQDSTSRVV